MRSASQLVLMAWGVRPVVETVVMVGVVEVVVVVEVEVVQLGPVDRFSCDCDFSWVKSFHL